MSPRISRKVAFKIRKTAKVRAKTNGLCFYCGGQPNDFDHVKPKFKGGNNQQTNLVASCRPCNQAKGHYNLQELHGALLKSTKRTFAGWMRLKQIWLDQNCHFYGEWLQAK